MIIKIISLIIIIIIMIILTSTQPTMIQPTAYIIIVVQTIFLVSLIMPLVMKTI